MTFPLLAIIAVVIVVVIAIGVVLIVLAVRGMRPKAPVTPDYAPMAAPPTTAMPILPLPLTAEDSAEIDRLVAADQKIAAIKVYRSSTGASLQEAKNRIDAWHPGGFTAAPPTAAPATTPGAVPASVAAEIDRLIAAGSPIAAIKVYRNATGVGLKEAKDAIDRWIPGASRA